MLEFLKSFTKFNIYDRARDCEINLKSFDSMTSMSVFFESVFKSIYNDMFEEDVRVVSSYSLNELLKDDYFVGQLRSKYGISENDYETIDKTIRIGSNKNKHGLTASGSDRQLVKKAFKCLYGFASNYLNVETGLVAPEWSDESYNSLVTAVMDENARAKAEEAYSAKIKSLKEERDILQKQKEEYQGNLLQLRNEIDQVRKDSIPKDQYEAISGDINRLKDEITKKETEIVRLEANAERTKKEKRLQKEAYEFEIKAIKKKLRLAEEKYKEVSDNSDQKDKLQELENAINDSQKQISDKQIELDSKEKELADISAKLHEAQDKIDELNRLHVQSLKERKEKQLKIDELNSKGHSASWPTCHKCGAELYIKPKDNGDGLEWECSNAPIRMCSGYRTTLDKDDYRIYGREIEAAKLAAEIVGLGNAFKRNASKFDLSGFNENLNTHIKCYPVQYTNFVPSTYLFESLCVPKEIFPRRHDLKLKKYSQFKIISNADVSPVDKIKKNIYSLILRLLNRGIILESFKETSEKFKDKFNKADTYQVSTPECLSSYIQYRKPFMISSSPREQDFANYYFPQVLGENWATYVFSQVGFDLLVPALKPDAKYYGQKVDFLIHKGDAKIVIELDGYEHAEKKWNDESRDKYLRNNGYTVFRFSNDAIDQRDNSITEELKEIIPQESDKKAIIELDQKYIIACKLSHQIAISIIKSLEQGYIGSKSHIKTSISSPLFSQAEADYIQTVTIQELTKLLKAYAEIYNVSYEWSFEDDEQEIFHICIGDGPSNANKGVIIRDCSIPFDFLCMIDKFDESVKPAEFSKIKGGFISEYIFGYSLKDEQYYAIERLITKKDSIVLLPTGYGKSTIYQLSSYIVPGMIIVISPLVSLIRDQVINLESKSGIDNVSYLYRAKDEKDQIKQNEEMLRMRRTAVSLLYIAPERLQIKSFEQSAFGIKNNNPVYCIAIDEAHCVSEWGHEFRPAYLNIGNSARHLFTNSNGEIPVVVALTGTASEAVLNDMKRDLKINANDAVIEPDSFERDELHFSLVSCSSKDKAAIIADIIKNKLPQKFDMTYEQFSALKGNETHSGIVFTPITHSTFTSQYSALGVQATLSNMLPELGSACYFSKRPPDYDEEATWDRVKNDNADKFKDNKLNLLVATKAFGMGIDKPNIRYIIHDGIPASLEEFYQEAGRAGRDKKDSQCIIVFSDVNHDKNIELLQAHYTNFNEKYRNYNETCKDEEKKDDLSTLLYFHSGSFAGVESESNIARKVIEKIKYECSSGDLIKNKKIYLHFSDDSSSYKSRRITDDPKLKEYQKALVRLTLLGIVEYYSIDYNNNEIIALLGTLEKENIIQRFISYATADGTIVAPIETELKELRGSEKEGWDFVEFAVKQLTIYVYENIESSRREAIRNMYLTADQMKNANSEQEQHEIVRKNISYYFNATTETKDFLKSIINEENLGVGLVIEKLNIDKPKKDFTKEEIENAERIYVRANRLLESTPTHPGLLLTRAVSSLIDNKYNKQLLFGDISAACDYAIKEYSVSKDIVTETLYSVSNLLMDNSIDLFNEYMDQLPESLEMEKMDMYEGLLTTPKLSDENRDYILLQYTLQKLNTLKGKA